jgi:hypothetical protein
VAYFDALTAPSKKLVWFEESGHKPFVDEPAKFNAAMVELVRPSLGSLARASSKRRMTYAGINVSASGAA